MKTNQKQKQALAKSAELWNAVLDIPIEERHSDDNNDIRFHIHAIQNILYAQMWIKEKGKI